MGIHELPNGCQAFAKKNTGKVSAQTNSAAFGHLDAVGASGQNNAEGR
jgi:hypothetical protein